jgi:hypothetical protein
MKKTLGTIFGTITLFGMIVACSSETVEETVVEEPVEEVVEEQVVEEPVVEETVEEPVEETIEAEPVEEPVEIETFDRIDYANEMTGYLKDLENNMYTFSDLMLEAGDNPNLMFDDNWKIDVSVQLVELQSIIDNVNALEVPSGLEDVHNSVQLAMDEYQFVVTNLPIALDNVDIDLLNEVTSAVNNGATFLGEATVKITELL